MNLITPRDPRWSDWAEASGALHVPQRLDQPGTLTLTTDGWDVALTYFQHRRTDSVRLFGRLELATTEHLKLSVRGSSVLTRWLTFGYGPRVLTGDPMFDDRFVIRTPRPELAAVVDDAVQLALLSDSWTWLAIDAEGKGGAIRTESYGHAGRLDGLCSLLVSAAEATRARGFASPRG